MIIDSDWYTNPGNKAENEDSCDCFSPGPDQYCGIVCDGLGGHEGGSAAAAIATKALGQWEANTPLPSADTIRAWMEQANREIIETRRDEKHMKTTAVALYVQGNQAVWAHIGDSRLYHFHNGNPVGHTEDHSLAQLAVRTGELTSRDEIPLYRDRSKIFRVIGDSGIQPEIHPPVTLEPGDHAFLLCSDGLWERLQEDEIMLDLHKAGSAEEWIFLLRCRAILRKSKDVDNNTAIAIWIKE